jgi:hypothetical protein
MGWREVFKGGERPNFELQETPTAILEDIQHAELRLSLHSIYISVPNMIRWVGSAEAGIGRGIDTRGRCYCKTSQIQISSIEQYR